MNKLNIKATAIFFLLIEGLIKLGDAKKIDNRVYTDDNGDEQRTFMAASVELIDRWPAGRIYSVAHYFIQNGDMCCDPDMTFMVARRDVKEVEKNLEDDCVYPISFQQAIPPVYKLGAKMNGSHIVWVLGAQKAMTDFANTWMSNIADQQELNKTNAASS